MDSLEFYCHELVEQRPATGTFLFNQQKHLILQSKKGWRTYGLRDSKTKKCLAQIFIHVAGTQACSPLLAPFGSMELYGPVTQRNITEFWLCIEADLMKRGVEHLRIKNYPEAYHLTTTKLLQKTLTNMHFTCTEEVSSIIQVDQKIFEKKIAISQRQKLRKSERRFAFSKVKLTELKSVYHFISTCRQKKHQSLSMSLPQLQKVVKIFPGNFILFKVANDNEAAAAAIVIKVSERILYTFYYAHDKRFDKISPVVFLISGIYQYAQQNGFELIDLGTSMVNGGINRPLLQFKKSIGGQPSAKFIFEKTLS